MKARRTPGRRRSRAGFTLIELLVAMALFALISLAGFTLLSGVIGARDGVDGRLARLSELQRAMYVMTLDLEAMDSGLEVTQDSLSFRRGTPNGSGPTGAGGMAVRYRLADAALHRLAGAGADQVLVSDVSAVEWRFLDPALGWVAEPITAPSIAGLAAAPERPRAIAVTLTLAEDADGPSGRLRRVVELPRQP